jgi:hypothetical protein
MAIINPFLLAGPDEVRKYQESRIKDWENMKGDEQVDFDHYFSELVDQWTVGDITDTLIKSNAFNTIDGIDSDGSSLIHAALKDAGILNESGFISLKTTDFSNLQTILTNISSLTGVQLNDIQTLLENIQKNKPSDFETFTKSMFTYLPNAAHLTPYKITESQSASVWTQLNQNNILDEYGLLLVPVNSDELDNAVKQLSGINDSQKERILQLLNKHPELSYHSYISDLNNRNTVTENKDSFLPQAGTYIPDCENVRTIIGLTKEELNYIRGIALMEWNVMLISQKSIHKSRKKSADKVKKERKKDAQENEKFLAEIEMKYQQEFKKRLNKSNKSEKK